MVHCAGSLSFYIDAGFDLTVETDVFVGVAGGAILTNEKYHKVLEALSVGALVLYIATLFTALP